MNQSALSKGLARLALFSALGLASVTPALSATPSLVGATVEAAVYCCEAPTEDFRISNIASAVVTDGIEFPRGALATEASGHSVIPLNIDIGADFIQLAYTGSSTARSGDFNGYAFSFDGASDIVAVSVNAASNFMPENMWFTADAIYIDLADIRFTSSSRLLLDVALAPVPEPSSWALLAAGLGLIGLTASRQRGDMRLTTGLRRNRAPA